MKGKKFLDSTKGKVIITSAVVAVIAAVVIVIVLKNKDTYRSIIAKGVQGTVNVVGEINNGQAYSGERLYGGDDVSVLDASSLTMLMDNDKYLYADANTHFKLVADQQKDYSKIRIILDKGSELNELKSKLGADDSYDVGTPNSTMSVRGTEFRVTVYTVDDIVYTLLEVSSGTVLVRLQTTDGTFNGVEKEFYGGDSVLIRGNGEFSEFVVDENDAVVRHLDYSVLPPDGVKRLIALLDKGEDDPTTEDPNTGDTTEEATTESTEDVTDDTTEDVTDDTTEEGSESTTENHSSTTEQTTGKTTQKVTEKPTEIPTERATEKPTEKPTEKTTEKTTEAVGDHTHTYGSWKVTTAATCTAFGREERACTICGKKETRILAATGHNYSTQSSKPATCTVDGYEQKTCTKCGATEKVKLPATGHHFGTWTVTKAAGCETSGTEERKCTGCGKSESRTVEALGHSYGTWVTKEATCTEDGSRERTCSRCGVKENETIAATGHKFGSWAVTKAAGCETTGTETATCSVCGKTETRTVVATGHKFGSWIQINAPSCTREGKETRTCSACGKTEERSVSALGHNYVQVEGQSGNYQRVYQCTRCGDWKYE
ncbi:MAG: FecR domain-containing protein [Eubacterium sp.]|nr:FecR domain-containing protein [Eubacterium sp.]